jgi:hypothetical protein
MSAERLKSLESRVIKIGESNKSVILIEINKEKALLVTPDGVDVWQEVEKENNEKYGRKRIEPIGGGLYRIRPGKFIIRDSELETRNEIVIKFSSNSDNLKKAA